MERAAQLMHQFSANCGRMMLFMESLRCIRTQHILQDSAAVPLSQVSHIYLLYPCKSFQRFCIPFPLSGYCFPLLWTARWCSIMSQVSLVPHEPGKRVLFDDKDWRHKSLGLLVRGQRFPGIRKTLSFTIVTNSGAHPQPVVVHKCRTWTCLTSTACIANVLCVIWCL